jgi:RNA polymerase sigma-70 factor (ECF subfamily)
MAPSRNPRDRRLQFEEAALPHLDSLYTAALRLTRNPEDGKDLLQDTVLRAYKYFDQFESGTNCRAWMLTIMYNLFRSAYRRGHREQLAVTSEEFQQEVEADADNERDSSENPEEFVARRKLGRIIERALTDLPNEFREALLLVDLHELDYQEVAMVLEIPLGTVKSRVSRGRAMMRVALEKAALTKGKTGT